MPWWLAVVLAVLVLVGLGWGMGRLMRHPRDESWSRANQRRSDRMR